MFVVRIISVKNIASKSTNPYYMVSELEILNSEVGCTIGNPLSYEEYKKKGNKSGSNVIHKASNGGSSSKNQSKNVKKETSNSASSSMERKPPQKQN